ncbi:midasin-like [Quercus lobata]|uniref:midasin-like n=1 Tax=Quercus lobata TaxID=97700 RepID=UPI001244D4EA|nr:midasin-like [Quercus lobata]
MGCFRPIARKVVDKAVGLLWHLGKSNANDMSVEVEEEEDLNEVVSVIEHYNQAGRGLDLHELACLAFCCALDLAPFLLGSILKYFEFTPPPFERISKEGKNPWLCGKVVTDAEVFRRKPMILRDKVCSIFYRTLPRLALEKVAAHLFSI